MQAEARGWPGAAGATRTKDPASSGDPDTARAEEEARDAAGVNSGGLRFLILKS